MSIKQGEYLKKLRTDNSLSQEQLAEKLGISRQSVSKWEQGLSTPDTDNFVKLSKLYGVAVDSLINGGDSAENLPVVEDACLEDGEPYPRAGEQQVKRKRSWFFVCYPILTVIIYAVIGAVFKGKGWATGWIVLLTIPLYYTGVIAFEKKKPVIFCYPVAVLIMFLLAGFFLNAWHPAWIIFLTIPIFYVAAAKKGR